MRAPLFLRRGVSLPLLVALLGCGGDDDGTGETSAGSGGSDTSAGHAGTGDAGATSGSSGASGHATGGASGQGGSSVGGKGGAAGGGGGSSGGAGAAGKGGSAGKAGGAGAAGKAGQAGTGPGGSGGGSGGDAGTGAAGAAGAQGDAGMSGTSGQGGGGSGAAGQGGAGAAGAGTGGAAGTGGSAGASNGGSGGSVDTTPMTPPPGTTYTQVSSGDSSACARASTGALYCWGLNSSSQLGVAKVSASPVPLRVDGALDWQRVAVGNESVYALKTDGSLWSWGSGGGVPQKASNKPWKVIEMSDFSSGVCGILADDTLDCETYLTPATSPLPVWRDVSVGFTHACALRLDGSAWCWGSNKYGQLGDGTTTAHDAPAMVGADKDWATIAAGFGTTWATRKDGSLWAWGTGDAPDKVGVPQRVGDASAWTAVRSGGTVFSTSSYVRRSDGSLWTVDGLTRTLTRLGSESSWVDVAAGGQADCAIRTDGSLACRGPDSYGSLGIGTYNQPQQSFVTIGTSSPWAELSLADHHGCFVTTEGSLWCTGGAALGVPGQTSAPGMLRVDDTTGWAHVFAGRDQTMCATKKDSSLWCWGNVIGETGSNATTLSVPTQLGTLLDWTDVAVVDDHACGLRTGGSLWCWGADTYGQLGDGAKTAQPLPVSVGTDRSWREVTSGTTYSCAISTTDALFCWGYSEHHTLTTLGNPATPTQLGAASWKHISAGGQHLCGVQTDGTMWCWGSSYYGQLGNGDSSGSEYLVPQQVSPGTTWVDVSAGTNHTCGRQSDGSLWCWGYADDGGLGVSIDPPLYEKYPQRVGTANDWLDITTGKGKTCGRRSDGNAYCWGPFDESAMGATKLFSSFDSLVATPLRIVTP